jgi:uncharacterized membrane protein
MNHSMEERPVGAIALGVRAGRWLACWLLLLLVVGGVLRMQGLERKSLWADELFTVNVALHHPLVPAAQQPWYRATSVLDIREGDTWLSVKAGEQSPPLFDLIEKASVQALGPTEFAARLPSALAACLLLVWVAAFAWLQRGTWLGRVLAWALLLLALHPGLIAYAQEARAYSLGASLVGMALVLWLQRWQHGLVGWRALGWGEMALWLAACYTHYNAAVLVALLLLPDAWMATRRRSAAAWLRLGTLGLLFMAWVAINARTILFTASGGVAWPRGSLADYVESVCRDVPNMLHAAWLAAALVLATFALLQRRLRAERLDPVHGRLAWAVSGLVLAYAVAAALVAYKAGMGHPRYYIFAVPVAMVAVAMVCAQLRGRWVVLAAVLLIGLLSRTPPLKGTVLHGEEDFHGMVRAAVQASDAQTVFLYPWAPNRYLYRLYLDRYLQTDSRPRLESISQAGEVAQVCARLRQFSNVVVMAHLSQPSLIDAVYAQCGTQWPQRERRMFAATFMESWRSGP